MWIYVEQPTPILNTPNFRFAFGGNSGAEIPLNSKNLPHFFEFVALKGTYFRLIQSLPNFICEITSPFYPSGKPLFIDSRFTKLCKEKKDTPQILPSRKILLQRMKNLLGAPYVWGGNWSQGIPSLLEYYPPKKPLSSEVHALWTLSGVDCSGLLYEASLGVTPRNTKELLSFGDPLKLSHLPLSQAVSSLEPLDMIIYPGHVLFVEDPYYSIESKFPFGVIRRPLEERLCELFQKRVLVDEWKDLLEPSSAFIIRRFSSF